MGRPVSHRSAYPYIDSHRLAGGFLHLPTPHTKEQTFTVKVGDTWLVVDHFALVVCAG